MSGPGFSGPSRSAVSVGRLLGAGHSLTTEGGGASYPDNAVWPKVARNLGCTRYDALGKGGAVLSSPEGSSPMGSAVYGTIGRLLQFLSADLYRTSAPYLPAVQLALPMWGYNDMAWMGPATFTSVFPLALQAALARLRAGAVFEDTDASVAYTGASWAPVGFTTANSGTQVKQVTTNGQSLTITVPADFPGGAINLRFLVGAAGQGALWTITGTGSCAGVNTTFDTRNANGFSFGGSRAANGQIFNCVKRLTGLPAGAGTITVTATTISTVAYFDCWEIESPTPPLIFLPLMYRPFNYSASAGAPYNAIGDADIVGAANSVNSAIVGVAAGFDQYVQTIALDDVLGKQQAYFQDNGVGSDNLHPNDLGHGLLANRIVSTIRGAVSQLTLVEPIQHDKRYFKALDGSDDTTLINSWADSGGSGAKVGYMKDFITGRVTVRGAVKKTTGAATDNIVQLPVGYRPSGTTDIGSAVYNGAAAQAAFLRVNADGTVQFSVGGSIAAGSFCPINCSFLAEQ